MNIVKSAWLKAGISLVLWPGLILSVAASEVRTLKYIEVTSLENISQLRLEFDEDLLVDLRLNILDSFVDKFIIYQLLINRLKYF